MVFFKKIKGENRLIKLNKSVSQIEAENFNTADLIYFLLDEFEKWNLNLDHFYITGPYPNNGWKTRKGFIKRLKKEKFKNIHHLMISDIDNKMFLSFTNWSHNNTIEVESDAINLELMVDENLMTNEELIAFGKRIYPIFNFEYGYILKQSKKYSISEGKIKKVLFSHSESNNLAYLKWSKYKSATKFGFIRSVYKVNFLSQNHLENQVLSDLIKDVGSLNRQTHYSIWTLTENEVEYVLEKLKNSSVLVENSQFDNTETYQFINKEIEKLTFP